MKRVSAILLAISAAVLLMACVNFASLSMGLSSMRFREVGLRKVLGARKAQVAGQFWGEAAVISCAALGLGVVLAEVFLPTFNSLMVADLDVRYRELWPFLLLLAALVALVSGSYPSLVLSGYRPVDVLKGRLKIGGSSRFGRGLVVLQLTLSVTFIAAALIMNAQMRLIAATDLGFDEESVIVVRLGPRSTGDPARVLQAYQALAQSESRILSVSGAEATLAGMPGSFMDISDEGREFRYYYFHADYGFLETTGIELIEGRDISRERDSEGSQAMLVNEAFARAMGWESPFGLPRKSPAPRGNVSGALVMGPGPRSHGAPRSIAILDKTVVGVVADFHNLSLHQKIAPVAIMHPNETRSYFYIFARCTPGSLTQAVELLETEWHRLVPDIPFHYTFLDEDVKTQYSAEQRWLQIVEYAAAFAIVIACFGAFGLTSLAVARRTREVGIRKVLGASVPSIVGLLSRDFAVLVVIGSALAWPLAHRIASDWLESFAYRVDLGPGVFFLGGLLTLVVVVLTVTTQCVKAGLADPVTTLRTE